MIRALNMTRNEKYRPNDMTKNLKQKQQRPQTTECGMRDDRTSPMPARMSAQSDIDPSLTTMHPGSMFDRTKQSFKNIGSSPIIARSYKTSTIKRNLKLKKSVSSEKSYKRLRNKMLQKLEDSKLNTNILNNN